MAAMSSEEKQATEAMVKGEKALTRWSMFSSASKFEDAYEWFYRAANQFKTAKKFQEAGEAFIKCAECKGKLNSTSEAANCYLEAAKVYRRVDPPSAITYYKEAITLYTEIGRFSTAAKLEKSVAEMYEEDKNLEEAIEHYTRAADYFDGEDATSAANTCRVKIALFSAQLERYEEAARLFEDIGKACLGNNLLKFNARGHFLNAGICILASGDPVAAGTALEKFTELDVTFTGSREAKFLEEITAALSDMDVDAFTNHVYNFDSVSKLDPWKTTMLLRVKNQIKGVGGGGAASEGVQAGAAGEGDDEDLT